MDERVDSLLELRKQLKAIHAEFANERAAKWRNGGPKDFHIRRLQVFCELMYADLLARTHPDLVDEAENAVRMREQDTIGKEEPLYSPPPDAPRTYIQETPPRDFVRELQAKANLVR